MHRGNHPVLVVDKALAPVQSSKCRARFVNDCCRPAHGAPTTGTGVTPHPRPPYRGSSGAGCFIASFSSALRILFNVGGIPSGQQGTLVGISFCQVFESSQSKKESAPCMSMTVCREESGPQFCRHDIPEPFAKLCERDLHADPSGTRISDVD